ncbi:MAG: FecR domain-containing protein [Ignavibacterium sp.]|nr:MAG: FecR domain-containing protein [Ignavibacterium sp.]
MFNKPKSSLLAKYISGECTDNERGLVEKWLKADINNEALLNSLRSIWEIKESAPEKSDTKAIWSKVTERISEDESLTNSSFVELSPGNVKKSSPPSIIKLIQFPALRYAAVLLIMILIPLLYYLNTQQSNINNIETWKTITVKNGGLLSITLSDGSKLTLDAGSRLQFPEEFSEELREIKLEGEVYLEIEHDVQKPFRVHTSNALIEVLGTKFNVRSWRESNKVEVVVVDGKVALEIAENAEEQIILNKGFTGSLSANGELTKPKRIDIDSYLSWMNGENLLMTCLFQKYWLRLKDGIMCNSLCRILHLLRID